MPNKSNKRSKEVKAEDPKKKKKVNEQSGLIAQPRTDKGATNR